MNAEVESFEALAAAWQSRLRSIELCLEQEFARDPVRPDTDAPMSAPGAATTAKVAASRCLVRHGDALDRACRVLGLDDVDQAILALAVAPEIDARFGRTFAAHAADSRRRWPSVELVVRLLADDRHAPLSLRRRLRPGAALLRCGAVTIAVQAGEGEMPAMVVPAPAMVAVATGDRPSDPEVAAALHGVTASNRPALAPVLPIEDLPSLLRAARAAGGVIALDVQLPLDLAALALAGEEAGCDLIRVDLTRLAESGLSRAVAATREALNARLAEAALVLDAMDGAVEAGLPALAASVVRAAAAAAVTVIAPRSLVARLLGPGDAIPVAVARQDAPSARQRRLMWHRALDECDVAAAPDDVAHVASRIRLAVPAIRAAAADVAVLSRGGAPASRSVLMSCAKARAPSGLDAFATRMPLRFRLDDIVLPAATRARVRELVAAIGARETVYRDWGFVRRSHAGVGLCILFSGASGVGKTATASAIAAELDGQDLYRIDLAAVVSKYIGETEKNLDRIFEAAQGCDALLFFDEADALFGKRSEVKDAHDRYANLETAYLLQKMEAHDGVSILATNLARNMDVAFARRIHYAVDFPRPDAAQRRELWTRMLDVDAPLASDLDLAFLAERFEITGGDIRAAILDAAFLAAAAGRPIGMRDLVRALARTLVKRGRPVQARDFRPYDQMLADCG
jgi:hypothetical protein